MLVRSEFDRRFRGFLERRPEASGGREAPGADAPERADGPPLRT
jgi:hypothetical protein